MTGPSHDFEELVRAQARELSALARLLSADPADAEDLLQATLLRVWRRWPSVAAAGDQRAYVRRVMVNTAVSGWRRRWRGEIPTAKLPEASAPAADSRVDDRDELIHAVRQLPGRQRAALVLRYFADLDDVAVAATLGCSVATVRSQISRALARLRVGSARTVSAAGQPGNRNPEER